MRSPLWLCGATALWLLAAGPAAAEESVKVGLTDRVFHVPSGKSLKKAAAPFVSLLESTTGVSGEAVEGGSAKALAAKLKGGEVQLGVFTGVEFAWAKKANPKLEPLLLCVSGSRHVRALLLVRADSKYKKPGDLAGRALAQPADQRPHSSLFLERKCVTDGSTPKKFYKKVQEAADAEEALDEVVDGEADAAVVDGQAWASYREGKPGAAKRLRVLLDSGPLPPLVVAYQPGQLGDATLKRVRDGLIGARGTRRGRQLLNELRLSGFEKPPDGFDKELAAVAKAYPPE